MIALDMETYGSRDLSKVGLHNYVNDPLFTPLVAVVAYEDGTTETYDFVTDGFAPTRDRLAATVEAHRPYRIAAHNAGFEHAVLRRIGIHLEPVRFVDTAVVAAYHGGGRSLESAAAQLLGESKHALGPSLIKTFCVPGPYQMGYETPAFQPKIREDSPLQWNDLIEYCRLDAVLSAELASRFSIPAIEQRFSALAMEMNDTGWPIDLGLVAEMQRRYEENLTEQRALFVGDTGDEALNLSSTTQMQKWCADRGVRSSSFDEERVSEMIEMVMRRLETPGLEESKRVKYEEVMSLLTVKRDMGGTSLKKLEVMTRQAAEDGRLHDSYLHFGAQATGRTTGRGVQMQNLPRLFGDGDDVTLLHDPATHWDNQKMARNLRQVFRATSAGGQLIVGDFSSVESRGLAWQAGEDWKLTAYRVGEDLYKVLASRIFGVSYDQVTKDQRQVGKTGELSCGYGAGGGAVHAFAKSMGVEMSEIEAAALVRDWRNANPATVEWWHVLHQLLLEAMVTGSCGVARQWGTVSIERITAPESLWGFGPRHSLKVLFTSGEVSFTRYIHGVTIKGRNLTYYKPSERKTGDLWKDTFMDPKTKRPREFTVYGGKLAGLLTQSLCREVFFRSLLMLSERMDALANASNLRIIGQFHDEIVLEWTPEPGGIGLDASKQLLDSCMTRTALVGFPLAAEIKSAHRYVK